MTSTVDARVERAWLDLVSVDPGVLRQLLARRINARPRRPPRWAKLESELADLRVRLADADAARYVRGDLDPTRHATPVSLRS